MSEPTTPLSADLNTRLEAAERRAASLKEALDTGILRQSEMAEERESFQFELDELGSRLTTANGQLELSEDTVNTLRAQLAQANAEAERFKEALATIDGIRNHIIGRQNVNWSADVYPLVAALHSVGFDGLSYEEARAAFAPAPRPTVCPAGHPLTWISDRLATCPGFEDALALTYWQPDGDDLMPRLKPLPLEMWEAEVGFLLSTMDPAEAARRLRELVEAARAIERYWFSPKGVVADPPGTMTRLATELRAALAPLAKEGSG